MSMCHGANRNPIRPKLLPCYFQTSLAYVVWLLYPADEIAEYHCATAIVLTDYLEYIHM